MSDDTKSKPSRLGRGLSSLIGEVEAVSPPEARTAGGSKGSSNEIAIDKIRRN
ncbi:MAG TPA: chromosome partitioning protein ParB, partial [Hyphomonas sp.]|nr:chromosome partitioning protein ParB [Hyphomonas sp.]